MSELNRRGLLRGALSFAAACPLCLGAARADDWGYHGTHGPKHWGKLSPEFQACSTGKMQTPINLKGATSGAGDSVVRDYKPMPLVILNNGHTIQCNAAPGSGVTIDGERFEFLQVHFHHPSEHLLNGKSKRLEAHFVHRNAQGQLAVLGVFYEPDNKPLAALETIWAHLPASTQAATEVPGVTVDMEALFPRNGRHFRYQGSLTTPPCSEGVTWVVYADPIETSWAQTIKFAKIFPVNNRPVQPLNGRSLLVTG